MHGYEKDIQSIRAWMKKNDVSASALGLAALNRSNGVIRLFSEKSTLRTLQRTLRHIQKYPQVKSAARGK